MDFNLSQILDSNILLEGRKEDAIKIYGEEHTDLVNLLSDVDPSGNNKYLNWMLKTALGKNKDEDIPTADTVARVVSDFHRNLQRINNKDINSYKTLVDLKIVVDSALKAEKDVRVSKEAGKIYEDEDVVIMAPFTVEASCKYGAGSKWCIAATNNSNNTNNHFDDYSKHSNFYYFLRKDVTRDESPRGYKWALQWRFDGGDNRKTWWDAQDSSHRDTPDFVTEKMMNAVSAYNPSHTKKKLDTQIQSFIVSPKVNEYKKFKQFLSKEQLSGVIDKIISMGNLNSNVFTTIVDGLSDEQKNDFIKNYVVGTVSSSDYEKMKEHLSVSQKESLVINNPQILNNFNIMNSLSEDVFNDVIKYNISGKIDNKLINNTDSKVLMKKWSMTDEQREKHNETSFYVFLSSGESDEGLELIDSLIKVDPLNPESYRTINMMKLKKQVQPSTKMYGIKTTNCLLDSYINKKDVEFPTNIMGMIKEKAVEIG